MTETDPNVKIIATNPNAHPNYRFEQYIEAGIVLQGTEVKSLRVQSPNLRDAYIEIRTSRKGLEAWLLNTHIAPYSHGNIWNHDPMRVRKLLLNKKELLECFGST